MAGLQDSWCNWEVKKKTVNGQGERLAVRQFLKGTINVYIGEKFEVYITTVCL